GLQEHSNLQNYSAGLGRRVLRDLLQDDRFLDRPRCDIALTELNVLSDVPSPKLDFHTRLRGHVEVEIAPCVTSNIRWSPRGDFSMTSSNQTFDPGEARQLLDEMDQSLSRIESVHSKLARLFEN